MENLTVIWSDQSSNGLEVYSQQIEIARGVCQDEIVKQALITYHQDETVNSIDDKFMKSVFVHGILVDAVWWTSPKNIF